MPNPPEFDPQFTFDRICRKCPVLIQELARAHEKIEQLKRHIESLQNSRLSPTAKEAARAAAAEENRDEY